MQVKTLITSASIVLIGILTTGCFENNVSNNAKPTTQKAPVTPVEPAKPNSIVETPKELFLFDASKTGKNHHIWVTDGSEEGTRPLLENYTMKATPGKDWLTQIDNKVVFLARPTEENDHDHDHDHTHKNATADAPPVLFVTDGTIRGTRRLEGFGNNAFERVASPFMKIDGQLYFLGFDDSDKFSLYRTDTQIVEKVSAKLNQAIGLDPSANFRLKMANNELFLFTQINQNNRIYQFQKQTKQWKELINTKGFAVAHPIQSVVIKDQLLVMTKKAFPPTPNGDLYQINTQTGETKLADSQFLTMAIKPCYENKLCGLKMQRDSNNKPYFQLRVFGLEQSARDFSLFLGREYISPMFIKSLHIAGNQLYIALKANQQLPMSKPTLHAISSNGQLSFPITTADSITGLSDIAKRQQETQGIQQHHIINGKIFLYAQSNKQPACNGFDYEPWVIDLKTQQASQLKDIMNKENEVHLPEGACISSFTQQTKPIKLNGKILFIANGGDSGKNPTGHELWVSDGTAQGTKILKDIAPGKLNGVLVEKGHSHGPGHHHP